CETAGAAPRTTKRAAKVRMALRTVRTSRSVATFRGSAVIQHMNGGRAPALADEIRLTADRSALAGAQPAPAAQLIVGAPRERGGEEARMTAGTDGAHRRAARERAPLGQRGRVGPDVEREGHELV